MSVKQKVRPKRRQGDVQRILLIGRFIGRAPRRTGTPNWFSAMEFRREARVALSMLSVNELEKAGIRKSQVELIAVDHPSIWSLATAKLERLRQIPGVGPGALRKIWQALKARHVNPDWTVD